MCWFDAQASSMFTPSYHALSDCMSYINSIYIDL